METSCGGEWERVQELLAGVTGLERQKDCIVAVSMLGEQGLEKIAEAIVILEQAKCFGAADTLLRMCKLEVRLALLKHCGRECIDRLRTCDDEKVQKSIQRALDAAAQSALGHNDVVQLLRLLPFCSQATRKSVKGLFPALDDDKVKKLTNDELVAVLRIVLKRIQKMDDPGKCLKELHSLLMIANDLEARDASQAMLNIISPVLSEFSKRPEVLCVAVELAASSQTTQECVNRVRALAALSEKIDESACEGLRSHLMLVLLGCLVHWGEPDYGTYKNSLQEILTNLELGLERHKVTSPRGRASIWVGKPTSKLAGLTEDFRRAVGSGDLRKAALLIRMAPSTDFGVVARERLLGAVIDRLAVAGYNFQRRSFSFLLLQPRHAAAAVMEQLEVALEMAIVLAETGDSKYLNLAGAILSLVFPTPGDQRWVIWRMLGNLSSAIDNDPISSMTDLLPRLCRADYSVRLDLILKMGEGQALVAQAVVADLLAAASPGSVVASFFKVLAHRIDLGPYLPEIHTTVIRTKDASAQITGVAEGTPSDDMIKLSKHMSLLNLSAHRIDLSFPWSRGWRLLWAMGHDPALLPRHPMLLLGAKAIDAAAADGVRGGADEMLHQLEFPFAHQALNAMLHMFVGVERLLSDDALRNVMRAMLSDEQLGRNTFAWIAQVEPSRRVALHASAADALISLLNDSSDCRFDRNLATNHAVGVMADMFDGEDVRTAIGETSWQKIDLFRRQQLRPDH